LISFCFIKGHVFYPFPSDRRTPGDSFPLSTADRAQPQGTAAPELR